jgi:hypothetical protein
LKPLDFGWHFREPTKFRIGQEWLFNRKAAAGCLLIQTIAPSRRYSRWSDHRHLTSDPRALRVHSMLG